MRDREVDPKNNVVKKHVEGVLPKNEKHFVHEFLKQIVQKLASVFFENRFFYHCIWGHRTALAVSLKEKAILIVE